MELVHKYYFCRIYVTVLGKETIAITEFLETSVMYHYHIVHIVWISLRPFVKRKVLCYYKV